MVPEIDLFDRQSAHPVDIEVQRARALSALPLCLESPGSSAPQLHDLPVVEVTFVDDSEIARVHVDFMGIPGATDVITFDHGEIVISTETAHLQAVEFGHPIDHELTLYIIHGLLHLNGHEDAAPEDFSRMKEVQERILGVVIGRG